MKNFPHQYNDLVKLRNTLVVVVDLNSRGEDGLDDGVLGNALARSRIYDFRPRIDGSGTEAQIRARIEHRLEEEWRKPAQSRGTETAAREMRRTLRYLGWLDASSMTVLPAGDALLATDQGSAEERELIHAALINIALEDPEGNQSHPMRLLLRLVDEIGLSSRSGMEVVLDARDDSPAEFARIAALAALSDGDRQNALLSQGWTTSQVQNARKILPAFAKQAELYVTDADGRFALTDAGLRLLGRIPVGGSSPVLTVGKPKMNRARRRSTAATTEDPSKVGRLALSGADRRALTAEEQALAADLLYERTTRHQQLVRDFAAQLIGARFTEDPAAFDLLVDSKLSEALLLCEMKSINHDEAAQVRTAVGQLYYYEYFSIPEEYEGRAVSKLVAVDQTVAQDLAEFLQAHDIGLAELVDGVVTPRNAIASVALHAVGLKFNPT